MKEIYENIQARYNIRLLEWNHDKDYVHILFKAHPNTEISKFINAYKSAGSRLIKKGISGNKENLWKETFGYRGFCLLTSCGVSIEVIQEYIENIKMIRLG